MRVRLCVACIAGKTIFALYLYRMLTRCGRVLYIAPFMVHRINACHAKRWNERAGLKERPSQIKPPAAYSQGPDPRPRWKVVVRPG
jgi:hypothetical protein